MLRFLNLIKLKNAIAMYRWQCFVLVGLCIGANAEQLHLNSGDVISGQLIQLKEDTVLWQDDKGQKSEYVLSQVKSIMADDVDENKSQAQDVAVPKTQTAYSTVNTAFETDKLSPAQIQALEKQTFNRLSDKELAQGPFVSPKHTFETWKKAANTGDMEAMANCYASFRKGQVRKQLKKIKRKHRKKMQNVSQETLFSLSDPYFQGDRATMEVTWNYGLNSETQILKFILQNKEWKIIQ